MRWRGYVTKTPEELQIEVECLLRSAKPQTLTNQNATMAVGQELGNLSDNLAMLGIRNGAAISSGGPNNALSPSMSK
jgi:hypothetical protein